MNKVSFSTGLQLNNLRCLFNYSGSLGPLRGPTLFIAALLFSFPAHAEWSIEAHLYTQHFADMAGVYENEKNFGAGFRYKFSENWAVLAGRYRNSLTSHEMVCGRSVCSWEKKYINSNYISFERSIVDGDGYELGAGVGVADGYEAFIDDHGKVLSKGNDFNPLAGPYLNIGNQFSIKIRYMFVVRSVGMQYTFD